MPGQIFVSDRFGDEEFDELGLGMTLADLRRFIDQAKAADVPDKAYVMTFPQIADVHQLAFYYG